MSEENNNDLFIIVALMEEWVTRLRSIEFITNDFTILHSPIAIANRPMLAAWSSKQPKRTIVLERKHRDQQRYMELYRVVIRAKLSGMIYVGFYFNGLNESAYRYRYWNLADPDLLDEIIKIIETWPDIPSGNFSPISEFLNSLGE